MRYAYSVVLTLLLAVTSLAADPYLSVGRVLTRTSGGSGTLIYNVPGKYALVLSCQHVTPTPGEWVSIRWDEATAEGIAWRVHRHADISVLLVASPTNLTIEPAVLAIPSRSTGPFTAVGFPSYGRGKRHVQTGNWLRSERYTLWTDKAPWSGFSGGGCFDRFGRLVGVTVWASPSIENGTSGGHTSFQALLDLEDLNGDMWNKP